MWTTRVVVVVAVMRMRRSVGSADSDADVVEADANELTFLFFKICSRGVSGKHGAPEQVKCLFSAFSV